MPDSPPHACSLTADELPTRLARTTALGRDALVDAHIDGTHAHLHFTADPGVRERVEDFVNAESECCPFFTMHIDTTGDDVHLTIDAPEAATTLLADLVAAFRVG